MGQVGRGICILRQIVGRHVYDISIFCNYKLHISYTVLKYSKQLNFFILAELRQDYVTYAECSV